MSGHDHDDHNHHHHHDHDHSELSETELRVRALESILTEKGYVDPTSLDLLIELYEKKIGPRNGIRVVAKAWADLAYRERLLKDATTAMAELDYSGRQANMKTFHVTKDEYDQGRMLAQEARAMRAGWTPHQRAIIAALKDGGAWPPGPFGY